MEVSINLELNFLGNHTTNVFTLSERKRLTFSFINNFKNLKAQKLPRGMFSFIKSYAQI